MSAKFGRVRQKLSRTLPKMLGSIRDCPNLTDFGEMRPRSTEFVPISANFGRFRISMSTGIRTFPTKIGPKWAELCRCRMHLTNVDQSWANFDQVLPSSTTCGSKSDRRWPSSTEVAPKSAQAWAEFYEGFGLPVRRGDPMGNGDSTNLGDPAGASDPVAPRAAAAWTPASPWPKLARAQSHTCSGVFCAVHAEGLS